MGTGLSATQLLWTVGYLAIAIIICMIAMAFIRKKYRNVENKTENTFTLAGLRELKKNNNITDKEFSVLKQNIVDAYSKSKKETHEDANKNQNWGIRDKNKNNQPNTDPSKHINDDDEDGNWIMINNKSQ